MTNYNKVPRETERFLDNLRAADVILIGSGLGEEETADWALELVLLENPDVENQHLEELYFRSTNRQKVRQCITAELLPIWHRFM